VRSYEQLDKLVHVVLRSNFGELIKSFVVNFRPTHPADGSAAMEDTEDAYDPAVPSPSHLASCFSKLRQTSYIKIVGSSRLAYTLLSEDVASSSFLPRLWQLELDCAWQGREDVLNPQHFVHLSSYRHLHQLSVACGWSPRGRPNEAVENPPPKLPQIASLDLGCSLSELHAPDFLSLFTNLSSLRLVEWDETQTMVELVSTLPSPSLLRHLTLKGGLESDGPNMVESWSIVDVLPTLSSLGTLSVSGGFFSTPPFFSALSQLPHLQSLRVGSPVTLAAEHLLLILSPATKPPSFLRLLLDNVPAGKRGTSIEHEDPMLHSVLGPTRWDDWTLPTWPRDFTQKDFLRVRQATIECEIDLSGTTVEAQAVEIDWDYEEDLLQEFLAGSDFESFDGEFW
jgi:hypothetical protein